MEAKTNPNEVHLTDAEIKQLVSAVRSSYGYEFGDYALSSFRRRLDRYMEIKNHRNVSELISSIRKPEVFDELLKEITVNTTDLFRDPGLWVYTKEKMIPKLFKKNEKVKIWHAACSTGEEVLSMCIILEELGFLDRAEIVASDINSDVIEQAKSAVYMGWRMKQYEKNFQQVFPGQSLDKYYTMAGMKAQFNKDLLRNVRFKNYDLVLDTPLSSYNLIVIRNVLIYFNFVLQEKVLLSLSSALDSKGYLVLGAQESLNWSKKIDNYMAVNNQFKVYKKLRD